MNEGVDPNEIAILYKEHRDAEELIEMLSRLKIPYKLEIGGNVLDDPEIKKLINYLKILSFGKPDDLLFFEVLHYDFFKIKPLDIYKISRMASETRKSIVDIILTEKKLPNPVNKFMEILLSCQHFAQNNTFAATFEHILNTSGFLNYLLKKEDSVYHLNRLQILYSEIKKLNIHQKDLNIDSFLKYLDNLETNDLIIKDKEIESDFTGVNLMTAHKAKGLEFEVVFVIKTIDKHWGNTLRRELIKLPSGILSIQKNDEDFSQEEERRLFYVALTRAKKFIFITYAQNYDENEENSRFSIPSIFIGELPENKLTIIDSKVYEKEAIKYLKLIFDKNLAKPNKELKEFIKKIVQDFILSSTSFNSYLSCPKQFFYDHIIKVPKAKDFNQSYGTAVHKALENLFLIYMRDNKLPTKKQFISFFIEALNNEILTKPEIKRAQVSGSNVLEKYYDYYLDKIIKKGPPFSCEYNFRSHNVRFNNIPITGKIDKIEVIDPVGKIVKITDYKTSRPKSLNELLGKTKTKDLQYLYQAFFYKLLAESDPQFSWKIGEIEFDFVMPDNSKFKKIIVPIDQKEYEKFKDLLTKTYQQIQSLKFDLNSKNCNKCDFENIC